MKLPNTFRTRLPTYLVAAALVVVPFHAFLTVWGSTLLGHYTLLRLWDDVLLAATAGVAASWLARDAKLRHWFMGSLLVRLVAAYAALTLLLGVVSLLKGDVSLKALSYGILSNLRYLLWFLTVLLVAERSPGLRRRWTYLLLVPAAAVSLFAVAQYTVLPHDFLGHFGYNASSTIAPIETINHDSHYIRVQSTLRGANPLGAYLVVVVSALAVMLLSGRRRMLAGVLGVAALGALYASGSRSAWIGACLALAVVAWQWFDSRRGRIIVAGAVAAAALLGAGSFVLLHENTHLQNELLHTQTHSAVQTSSNSAHLSAVRSGLNDVAGQPLGDGPGTAGPASVYNTPHASRIAENYYIQIAQETGWLGLALFLSIICLVAVELYQRARVSRLALVLLAAFVGLAFVNLLSHAWTDDTLAFVWWGLAGIALARPGARKKGE